MYILHCPALQITTCVVVSANVVSISPFPVPTFRVHGLSLICSKEFLRIAPGRFLTYMTSQVESSVWMNITETGQTILAYRSHTGCKCLHD